jgi:hypothetical protein
MHMNPTGLELNHSINACNRQIRLHVTTLLHTGEVSGGPEGLLSPLASDTGESIVFFSGSSGFDSRDCSRRERCRNIPNSSYEHLLHVTTSFFAEPTFTQQTFHTHSRNWSLIVTCCRTSAPQYSTQMTLKTRNTMAAGFNPKSSTTCVLRGLRVSGAASKSTACRTRTQRTRPRQGVYTATEA